jgi:hypothetical protein
MDSGSQELEVGEGDARWLVPDYYRRDRIMYDQGGFYHGKPLVKSPYLLAYNSTMYQLGEPTTITDESSITGVFVL